MIPFPACKCGHRVALREREHHGELHGIARFTFHEGKVDEFKRLSALCLEIVRTKDTGTLQYEIYFNDNQFECIVLERYRDSDQSM